MYLTYHSYGQYVLIPWGYDKVDAPNFTQLRNMGNVAADAMRNADFRRKFRVGNSAKLLGSAAGVLRCIR